MRYRSIGITVVLLITAIVNYLRMAKDGINRNVEYLNVAVMLVLSALIIFHFVRFIKEKNKQS